MTWIGEYASSAAGGNASNFKSYRLAGDAVLLRSYSKLLRNESSRPAIAKRKPGRKKAQAFAKAREEVVPISCQPHHKPDQNSNDIQRGPRTSSRLASKGSSTPTSRKRKRSDLEGQDIEVEEGPAPPNPMQIDGVGTLALQAADSYNLLDIPMEVDAPIEGIPGADALDQQGVVDEPHSDAESDDSYEGQEVVERIIDHRVDPKTVCSLSYMPYQASCSYQGEEEFRVVYVDYPDKSWWISLSNM